MEEGKQRLSTGLFSQKRWYGKRKRKEKIQLCFVIFPKLSKYEEKFRKKQVALIKH